MNRSEHTTLEWIRAVKDEPRFVVRNLQITQTYHELAKALVAVGDGRNLPWCAFAVWASKQVGTFIRNDEIPAPIRRFLGLELRPGPWQRVRSWFTPAGWLRSGPVLRYARCTVEDLNAAVTRGNRLVFSKLAPLYARYLDWLEQTNEDEPGTLDAFLDELRQDPEAGNMLAEAFDCLHRAGTSSDPVVGAQLALASNLLVGWNEQMRLQEAITDALRAPIDVALDDPDRLFTTWPVPRFVRRWGAALFRRLLAPAIHRFQDEWLALATRYLMTLSLPGQVLALGSDLPRLASGQMFPADLENLTVPEARQAIARLDRLPNDTAGSGARDWTDLNQRMNYIADLFRSRQQSSELLQPPFIKSQVSQLLAGKIPAGPL